MSLVGFEDFTAEGRRLEGEIAQLVAQRDSLLWSHPASRREAESRAADIVQAYRRSPREPETIIDGLCQDILDIEADLAQHRRNLAERREQLKPQPVDHATVRLQLRDDATGKTVRITLPREWVAFAE